MKILSVDVQGFRSFTEVQTIDFKSLSPGLYHISGLNLVEPELEANGAGKSSLFEAIFWGSYGKTSRGLRASSVKNWDSQEQCAVILQLETASKCSGIFRSWGPNILEVDEEGEQRPIEQSQLEPLLGLTPALFLQSIYFAQDATSFVDLPAPEQTALFSSVLNLELWERAAKESGDTATTAEKRSQALREQLAGVTGQIQALVEANYEKEEAEWQKQQAGQIRMVQAGVLAEEKRREKVVAEALAAEQNMKGAQGFMSALKASDHALSSAQFKEQDIQGKLTTLKRSDYTKCPTCGGPVSNKHIKDEIKKAGGLLAAAHQAVLDASTKHAKVSKDAAKVSAAAAALTKAEQNVVVARIGLTNATRELSRLRAEKNPYTKMRVDADEKGERLVSEMEQLEQDIAAADAEYHHAQFWVKGFKEIRLSQIHASLDQLTLECNEVLFQLGLQDWAIAFDVERETKSGTINKSFTTMIKSPQTKDAVPWEVWSKGEGQRLRIAISMGFANLICSKLGIQPNLEMWDEPTAGLSDAGIQDLLLVLSERAQRTKKVILLADHRVLDFGGFAGTIEIVKDKNGSIITGP